MLTGTMIGFIAVGALLAASILLAKFLSRTALALFIAAFVGGVVMTLVGGVQKRDDGNPIMGQFDEKEFEDLKKKVEADPRDVKSRERLGHLYLQMQEYENVFKTAHEVLQIDPESVESRVHIGMVLFVMNQTEEAMAQFDQVLQKEPNYLEALAFKGMVELQGENDPRAARKTWGEYLKRAKPGDPGWGMVQVMMSPLEMDD